MSQFDYNKEHALTRALLTHGNNFDRSAHWALGYMAGLLKDAVGKMPPHTRADFIAKIDGIIDNVKKTKEAYKAAG